MRIIILCILFLVCLAPAAQKVEVSEVWQADLGNGNYKNPVIHADYSDPDVVRVGDDYYMTASSFEDVPGLPILHSRDLVNWKLVGHALKRLVPEDYYSIPRHGGGVWAPSIRYHKGEFWIYYPDPDFGIYLTKAKNPKGPWSLPLLVEAGKGLIDPCPLWDEDGKVYLVHAFAGSRAGIKSILVVKQMNTEGTKVLDAGKIVYDGHQIDPTIEGPKFYKRNGWYYIFTPAGGVKEGWQLVLRSKNVYGPYERKIVLEQGSTDINGPHQGAWVHTTAGEDWFIHFQDKGAYGRIVHLQPVKWLNDWPMMGSDKDGNGIGEPVLTHKKPVTSKNYLVSTPPDSDDFNANEIGLQWQWPANAGTNWAFTYPSKGLLRLYAIHIDSSNLLWDVGNVLQQKFPAEQFAATTRLEFSPNTSMQEKAGLSVMGLSSAAIALSKKENGIFLVFMVQDSIGSNEEVIERIESPVIYLRVAVDKGGICRFSYSLDGVKFVHAGDQFNASPGRWKGAKLGLFCISNGKTNDNGFADFDWFKISPL